MKKVIRILLIVLAVITVGGVGTGVFYYEYHKPVKMVRLEAKSDLPDANLLLKHGQTGAYYEDSNAFANNHLGVNTVWVRNGLFKYRVDIEIVDTLAPEITFLKNVEKNHGDAIEFWDCVETVWDGTDVTYGITNPEALASYGYVELNVWAKDEAANETNAATTIRVVDENVNTHVVVEQSAKLEESMLFANGKKTADYKLSVPIEKLSFEKVGHQSVVMSIHGDTYEIDLEVPDVTPPVIMLSDPVVLYMGESMNLLSDVSAMDDSEEDIEVTVDDSGVNKKVEGTYTAIYTASDSAGNTTTRSVTVIVSNARSDEEKLDEQVSRIISSITNSNMTDLQKVQAVYSWTKEHVAYIGYAAKSDWKSEALYGITNGKGDCFTAFAVSKALLTAAGVTNADITRSPDSVRTSHHYWNLIYIDGAWYHYDSCHRSVPFKGTGYMFTDAQAEAYNKEVPGYYTYDESLYPDIQ